MAGSWGSQCVRGAGHEVLRSLGHDACWEKGRRGRRLLSAVCVSGGGGRCSAERPGAGGGGRCSAEKTAWTHSSSQIGQEQLQGPPRTQELAGQDRAGPEPGGGGAPSRAWVLSETQRGEGVPAKAHRGGGVADTAVGEAGEGVSSHSHHQEPVRGAEAPPDGGQRGERRPRLQVQHSENEDQGIQSSHFMANSGNGGRL